MKLGFPYKTTTSHTKCTTVNGRNSLLWSLIVRGVFLVTADIDCNIHVTLVGKKCYPTEIAALYDEEDTAAKIFVNWGNHGHERKCVWIGM